LFEWAVINGLLSRQRSNVKGFHGPSGLPIIFWAQSSTYSAVIFSILAVMVST